MIKGSDHETCFDVHCSMALNTSELEAAPLRGYYHIMGERGLEDNKRFNKNRCTVKKVQLLKLNAQMSGLARGRTGKGC